MDFFRTVFFMLATVIPALVAERPALRWCVTKEAEEKKCKDFVEAYGDVLTIGPTISNVRNYFKTTSGDFDFNKVPVMSCVRGIDVFDCMEIIDRDEADIVALEAGLGYFGGRYHNLQPILAEKYDTDSKAPLQYYAVAVKRTGIPLRMDMLYDRRACLPGVGMGAGWVNPISFLLENQYMQVTECNAIVKTVTNFFGQLCLPGALNSFYNPFGVNPTTSCQLCTGSGAELCSGSDPHAGFDGAYRCLNSGAGDFAFLRHDTVSMMTGNTGEFELLCNDLTNKPVDQYETCNFGTVPNDIIMTSSMKSNTLKILFKEFLLQLADWFGRDGSYKDKFQMFSSASYAYMGRSDLLFSDATMSLVDVGNRDTYYTWIDDDFRLHLNNLNKCPIGVARLCVVSEPEQNKCERMVEVFRGKDIKPNLDCLLGTSTRDCMELIYSGDADMMMLDAGDIYTAGREYGLVPIAAEDYGDMTHSFKVVAAAWKRVLNMTLFNLKEHKSCLAGIGRGDGWIVPLNIFIETQQFIPQQCTIFDNIGQLFIRSCIPGALDKDYNPNAKPINLCEACQGGGFRKCQRNAEELYYGTTGAFRCLVENAGDVAFVHHLTVGDNTDGRNQAIWARNRRSDDYELLCKDGTRVPISEWETCYLGVVPAAAMVVASFREKYERDIYWNLFSYGQQFFSSDIDGDFHLFDSGLFYQDLIFNDEAVRLIPLMEVEQNYQSYLGWDFINQIHNLDEYQCVPTQGTASLSGKVSLLILLISAVTFLL